MKVVVLTLLVAACGSPPPGAYRCGAADEACPGKLHCMCGLCVSEASQAPCQFTVTLANPTVEEHQDFTVTLQALQENGTPATHFNGQVDLSSTWGDLTPKLAAFKNGQATVTAQLNRETVPPQTANLKVTLGEVSSQGGKITVRAAAFMKDATAVVEPGVPFGFASIAAAEPNVIRVGNEFRMYFTGLGGNLLNPVYGIGLATSTDGKKFTPVGTAPVLASPLPLENQEGIANPWVFLTPTGYSMALRSGTHDVNMPPKIFSLKLATSIDGIGAWTLGSGFAVEKADCTYCSQNLEFPSVISDQAGYVMYFSASMPSSNLFIGRVASVGRAVSSDGINYVVDPAPVLSGDLSDETYLLAPRVLIDGSVLKMWYSYARRDDTDATLCRPLTKAHIGYATSSDGLFWIRSPSNPVVPITPMAPGFENGVYALLAGSVGAVEGDPKKGFVLYYSTFRQTAQGCIPNGIGRATRR